MKKIVKILLIIFSSMFAVLSGLFIIYFFNLDMKLMVNVIAPLFDKVYDNRKRKQYV